MKTAIVTVGADPIAASIARRLAGEGWSVVLAGADTEAVRKLVRDVSQCTFTPLDVTDLDAVDRCIGETVRKHGSLDALVNAAGGREGAEAGAFCDSDPQSWAPIMNLQLRSVMGWCRSAVPALEKSGGGSIVSVVAFEGVRGSPISAVFSAASGGVIVFNQMLSFEVQAAGIRVNTLLPCPPDAISKAQHRDPHEGAADAVAFLVSDRGRWTAGACLDSTGGWALY